MFLSQTRRQAASATASLAGSTGFVSGTMHGPFSSGQFLTVNVPVDVPGASAGIVNEKNEPFHTTDAISLNQLWPT
jgi:hypothetical protein